MTKPDPYAVINEAERDLERIKSRFGLNTEYFKLMARVSTKKLRKPRLIVVMNSFLSDMSDFTRISISAVLNIAGSDINKFISQVSSSAAVKRLARQIKEISEGRQVVVFYVVDEELLNSLIFNEHYDLWRIREIFLEKAAEFAGAVLSEIKKVFEREGLRTEVFVFVGDLLEEISTELGGEDVLVIGGNRISEYIEEYFSEVKIFKLNEVIKLLEACRAKPFAEDDLKKINKITQRDVKLEDGVIAKSGGGGS
jgi:nucleotide-binding universal stress UspA family protein